jgi:hypothetical protein
MAAPIDYAATLDQTKIHVESTTAGIKEALDKVERCNLDIIICNARHNQVSQIAAGITEDMDFSSTEALSDIVHATSLGFTVEDLTSDRYKLLRERQVLLDGVKQAFESLAHHRDVACNLATDLSGQDRWYDLYHDVLILLEIWDAEINALKTRRDLLVNQQML